MGSLEEESLVNGSLNLSVTPRASAPVSSTEGSTWDDGLGSISVGVLYLSLTFSSLAAPLFVVWLGSKRALLVGLSGYWAFTSANLYPTWVTMIPASLFLGFTASILWCAEGTYLTYAAKSHAVSCDISEDSAIGLFNGEFWGVYASNQVLHMFRPLQSLQHLCLRTSGDPLCRSDCLLSAICSLISVLMLCFLVRALFNQFFFKIKLRKTSYWQFH